MLSWLHSLAQKYLWRERTRTDNWPTTEHADDSFARVPIAERVGDLCHAVIGRAIGQQLERRRNDGSPVSTDEAGCARLNALGPFCDLATDQDRLSERRCVL